jgi:integrase
MPKAKITKSFVDSVPLSAKGQTAYCDSELRGFYLIVGTESKTYVAQKDIQGRSIRCTIGRHGHFTPEQARKIAKDKLYLMAQGIDPNAEEDKKRSQNITLEDVLNAYLSTRRNLKERTQEDYRYIFDRHLSEWKDTLMTDITKDMVGAYHAKIAEESGSYTANKAMRIVRALFNFAQATYDICPANPVVYLTRVKAWYKEERKRTYIKGHELKQWWEAVHALENDTYRDFLLFLLFTGLRRGEAQALMWENIDFKDRTFTIPDTKNGDPLTLPMGDFLYSMFEGRRKRYGNYTFVFPGTGEYGHLVEPKKGIAKVVKNSSVKFTCHDLRRTFITIAESLEISAYALKRLINHRVTDVTGGYIIVDVERLRSPVQKIEAFILEKVRDQKGNRTDRETCSQ